jgi:subtilisin family serine protease
MKPMLFSPFLCLVALGALAADRPVGRLADGTFYVRDEIDFALKADVARALSPADATRRPVSQPQLHTLHPAIIEVVGGHTSSARWLKGEALPLRLRHEGPDVPLTARSLKAKLKEGQDAALILDEFRQHPDVEWACLNQLHPPAHTPNDPRWREQWGTRRVGATNAWDVPQTYTNVRIAIIDTGVDFTHPDLASRIVYDRGFGDNSDGDAKRDQRGQGSIDHGTHVAGIAAAIRDNGIGIAGIATAGIMAMGCAVWKENPYNSYWIGYAADAINDAVDNGADVINCSFGNSGLTNSQRAALDYAESHGVVVVCAAGNENTDVDESGCRGWNEHPWPLIVSATQQDDSRLYLDSTQASNFGDAIDLAAPGRQILSTWTTNYCPPSPDGVYGNMVGTSQAAPLVAGAIALVKGMNPNLVDGAAAKELLYRMAEDLGDPGKDPIYGYGLLQLKPEFLETVKAAYAFVGPNTGPRAGTYSHPYVAVTEAVVSPHVLPGSHVVLNGGLGPLEEYHYPEAVTIAKPLTLTVLPDRCAVIGQ